MNLWDNLTRVVIFLIFAATVLCVVLFYTPEIKTNERMRKTVLELDKKIEKEEEVAKKLEAQTRSLQDPRTVERLARERLSYAKPGEIVVHFEQPQTNAHARPRY
jgi:cell division protein FtsB